MAGEVTTEVVNETDGEVLLKHRREGGVFTILSTLPGRGDGNFTIKTIRNAGYKEYKLVETSTTASATSDDSFLIVENDCLENERLVFKKDRAEGKPRLDKIKRGMSVTEVINDTEHDFDVIENRIKVRVLKAGGEYLIQWDPKGKSGRQSYSLVEGKKPPMLISTEDLVKNQRLTVSGVDSPAVTSKIPRDIYLTEVFNKTKTSLKVMRSEASVGSGVGNSPREPLEMVTLQGEGSQSFTIEYDPRTKTEYWVQTMAEPPEKIPIPPENFVKGKRIDIKADSAGIKLESAGPRPVPTPTTRPGNVLSRILESIWRLVTWTGS